MSDSDSKLEILSTGTQQKWSYDASNCNNDYYNGAFTENSGRDMTLDAEGDIVLDAKDDIMFKGDGIQFLKFTNNSGNCTFNGSANKNIIL